jgi:TRAP-type C4-dicarboxylate transport system permease small subunit
MAHPAEMKLLVHKAYGVLAAALRGVVMALTVVMLLALSYQVVMRYVFNHASSWSEELALTCFSWSMLLAIAAGVRDGIHVRMDLLADNLPGLLSCVLDKLVNLGIAFIGGFIAWSGTSYVKDSADVVSAAIGYPITWLYLCAPVGGALIAVFALERVVAGPAVTPVAVPEVESITSASNPTTQIG